MTWQAWLVLPPFAALIGWVTNWLAVRMIFRPYRPIGIPGLKLQGLLPKRRHEFAQSIAATIEDHLFSAEDVKKVLRDPEVKARLLELVEERIDRFLKEKLTAGNPFLANFMQGPFAETMRTKLVAELSDLFDTGGGVIAERMDDKLDLRAIVEEKIEGFDMRKLEEIVLAVAKKELRAIEVLGAVLGFLVGVAQLVILSLIGGA